MSKNDREGMTVGDFHFLTQLSLSQFAD